SAIGCGSERQTRIAAAGRTAARLAASPAERSPARRTTRYSVSNPTNTNGAAGRTTAPNPTAATSSSAGTRVAIGAPDQPSIRPVRPEPPAPTPPSPTRLPCRCPPGTTKRPKEPLYSLDGPP